MVLTNSFSSSFVCQSSISDIIAHKFLSKNERELQCTLNNKIDGKKLVWDFRGMANYRGGHFEGFYCMSQFRRKCTV